MMLSVACGAITIRLTTTNNLKYFFMEKSVFQQVRDAFTPVLPVGLRTAVGIKEGEATTSVADQEVIKKMFPNTYGMPVVEFVEG